MLMNCIGKSVQHIYKFFCNMSANTHKYSFPAAVLSIHKRPAAASDISFPMKGWRGMVDWARSSEDRVTITKNILSTGKPGEHPTYVPICI